MDGDSENQIDLDLLSLRSGEAKCLELELEPDPPLVGGETLQFERTPIAVRVDVSRTSSGYALRLRAEPALLGICARCLGDARLQLEIEAWEVDQGAGEDSELISPYVQDGLLDATGWLHDAIRLAIPERLLCREDCAGLCDVCGVSLNDFALGEHTHEAPRDPRFAKLRELEE